MTHAATTRIALAGLWILVGAFALPSCTSKKSESDDEAAAVNPESEKSEESDASNPESGPAKAEESNPDDESNEAPEKATVGKPAPGFTLTDAAGEEHSLEDYRGKIVVFEWTSTECPYVKRHYDAKTTKGSYEELGDGETEVQWLAIDSSNFATAEASKKWKEKYGVEYPFLLVSSGEVGRKYGAKATPHMYVIDAEGVLRYEGAIDDDEEGRKEDPTNYVVRAVQALQNGESVEPKTTDPYGCSVKYDG